jgi:hypothetical protein
VLPNLSVTDELVYNVVAHYPNMFYEIGPVRTLCFMSACSMSLETEIDASLSFLNIGQYKDIKIAT